jgi:hypothetical protein
VIHPIDLLAPVGFWLDARSRVFTEGWGDERRLALLARVITAADPIPVLEVEWGRKEEHRGFRIRRGVFTSPVADALPEQARVVTVEWIEPAQGSRRTTVLLPAWKDEAFAVRRTLARMLAERGIGSLIADIPHYGARRTRPDSAPAIGTVADFAVMGYGAVAEGRALVGLASEMGEAGVAGYSMGGNLAAYVSATLPRPVATAPLAASHGPAPVYLDGALRRAIDWQALGGRDEAQPKLRSILSGASVLDLPQLSHHSAAIVVSAGRDGFVHPTFSRDLAAHWDAELRTVERAGHGTLLWRHKSLLIDAICDSFDRVSART